MPLRRNKLHRAWARTVGIYEAVDMMLSREVVYYSFGLPHGFPYVLGSAFALFRLF